MARTFLAEPSLLPTIYPSILSLGLGHGYSMSGPPFPGISQIVKTPGLWHGPRYQGGFENDFVLVFLGQLSVQLGFKDHFECHVQLHIHEKRNVCSVNQV